MDYFLTTLFGCHKSSYIIDKKSLKHDPETTLCIYGLTRLTLTIK